MVRDKVTELKKECSELRAADLDSAFLLSFCNSALLQIEAMLTVAAAAKEV